MELVRFDMATKQLLQVPVENGLNTSLFSLVIQHF